MKFKPCQQLFGLDEQQLKEKDGEAITLSIVSIQALLADLPGENAPGEKKMHRWNLASRIKHAEKNKAEEIDLPAEDIALIKERLGRVYPPAIMGPAWQAIEG